MPNSRIAAAAVAVLLLAGCGPVSGNAPSATSRTAAPTHASSPKQAAKSPAPATASTATGPSAKRLQAPKQVTLADNGFVVDLKVGDTFTLQLPAPKGWKWKVVGFDSTLLAERPGPTGTLGAFRAVKAGHSLLTAEEIPPCGSRCPANAKGPVFNVAVQVAG